jgi:hypothetical protein
VCLCMCVLFVIFVMKSYKDFRSKQFMANVHVLFDTHVYFE